MEKFNLDELEKSEINSIEKDDILTGSVIKVTKDTIYLDINYKMEGKIDALEFETPPLVNDKLEVIVQHIDEINGDIIISHNQAKFMKEWNNIIGLQENSPYISGKILVKLEKGYQVDIGVPAFLPFSQMKRVEDFNEIKDKQLMFKIIDIREKNKKIILSRRQYLNETNAKKKKEIFENIEEDMILEGLVKNIKNFGVFIDLGGVDALIPKSELSWSRNPNPNDLLTINQQVKGSVISFDKKEGKITLSMKNIIANPWNHVDENYQEGMIAKGKIVKIINSGVFVELEPGIEGYISKDNLTWTKHIKSPFDVVKTNDVVEFKILSIDKIKKKISLGLKQILPNPWEEITKKYMVGQKLTVKIKHIAKNGAFAEIDENIEGFIDMDDVSWIKHYRTGKDAFKIGDILSTVIIDIDQTNQLIKLSLKQLLVNPWQILEEKKETKTPVIVKISKITRNGTYARLENDLNGFIPVNQYDLQYIKELDTFFKPNEEVKCIITNIDEKRKLAICSSKAYKRSIADKELEQYIKKEPVETATLGDFFNLKK